MESHDQKVKVYLVVGVPGCGKSWVCNQLKEHFNYVPHDQHYNGHPRAIMEAAKTSKKHVLADCPFAERPLRDQLAKEHIEVIPVFIVEAPEVVKVRYESRAKPLPGRAIPKGFMTRAKSIGARADEWKAFKGTSDEVLRHLLELARGK
jgi:hypothetical protein